MAINLVRSASNIGTFSTQNTATATLTCAFGSNNAAGNTIVAWVFTRSSGGGVFEGAYSVADSKGNTYSQAFTPVGSGNNDGPGIGCFFAQNIQPGANTLTFSYQCGGGFLTYSFDDVILIAEYSGMPSPSVVSSNTFKVFGAGGNSPITVSLTDSHGSTVNVQFGSGVLVPGSDSSGGVVNFLSGGVNYLIAAHCGASTMSVPTSSYQTFVTEQTTSATTNFGLVGHYYDYGVPGPATITQPQVCVVT